MAVLAFVWTALLGSASADAAVHTDRLRGEGAAIVRIDAATISVRPMGDGRYRLTLPEDARGQWMGDRAAPGGGTRLLVGRLTAVDLAKRWSDLRYRSGAWADGTLTWASGSTRAHTAAVRLTRPVVRPSRAVTIDVVSAVALPRTLIDSTVNLARAVDARPRAFPVRTSYNLADSLVVESYVQGVDGAAQESIWSGPDSCFSQWITQQDGSALVPATTCGSTVISGEFGMAVPDAPQPGEVVFWGTIQPFDQPSMQYTATVVTWTTNG